MGNSKIEITCDNNSPISEKPSPNENGPSKVNLNLTVWMMRNHFNSSIISSGEVLGYYFNRHQGSRLVIWQLSKSHLDCVRFNTWWTVKSNIYQLLK